MISNVSSGGNAIVWGVCSCGIGMLCTRCLMLDVHSLTATTAAAISLGAPATRTAEVTLRIRAEL